jgi:hypothetical protein
VAAVDSTGQAGSGLGGKVIVAAAVVTIVTGGIYMGDRIRRKHEPFKLFFCDEDDVARADLLVETPDGPKPTVNNGEIRCPASWEGKEIVIYAVNPRRWLKNERIVRKKYEPVVKIVVPRRKPTGVAAGSEANRETGHKASQENT